jgi:hypothetical protein
MDKLIIHPGGHPMHNDDLLHLQTAMLQGFTALGTGLIGSSLGSGWYKICGFDWVVVSPGVIDLSAGYVYWDGEIWYYPGGTGLACTWATGGFTTDLSFEKTISHKANNPVVYADGLAKNVHQIRRLNAVTIPFNVFNPFAFCCLYGMSQWNVTLFLKYRLEPYFYEIGDSTLLTTTQEAWVTPALTSSYSNVAGSSLKYKKLQTGQVVMQGKVCKNTTINATIFTLDALHRPLVDCEFVISFVDTLTAFFFVSTILIKTNGDVKFISLPSVSVPLGTNTIDLSPIQFLTV